MAYKDFSSSGTKKREPKALVSHNSYYVNFRNSNK